MSNPKNQAIQLAQLSPQQLKVRVLPRVPSPHAPQPSVLRRGKFKRSVAIFPIAPREVQPPV